MNVQWASKNVGQNCNILIPILKMFSFLRLKTFFLNISRLQLMTIVIDYLIEFCCNFLWCITEKDHFNPKKGVCLHTCIYKARWGLQVRACYRPLRFMWESWQIRTEDRRLAQVFPKNDSYVNCLPVIN